MTKFQRIKNFIAGILMLICAAILFAYPKDGYIVVLIIIDVSLLIASIKGFIYYFTMARFMVDGRRNLYKNLLLFDLAVFASVLMNIPVEILVVYVSFIIGFAAVIDILYGIQAKKMRSPMWVRKLIHGVVELAVCIVSLCFIRNTDVMVYIYALVIIYSGITRIIESFRKSAIIYIS